MVQSPGMTDSGLLRPRWVLVPAVAGSVVLLLAAIALFSGAMLVEANTCLDTMYGLDGASMTEHGCTITAGQGVGQKQSAPLPSLNTGAARLSLIVALLSAVPPWVALAVVLRRSRQSRG